MVTYDRCYNTAYFLFIKVIKKENFNFKNQFSWYRDIKINIFFSQFTKYSLAYEILFLKLQKKTFSYELTIIRIILQICYSHHKTMHTISKDDVMQKHINKSGLNLKFINYSS